jgi:hypothetical protein
MRCPFADYCVQIGAPYKCQARITTLVHVQLLPLYRLFSAFPSVLDCVASTSARGPKDLGVHSNPRLGEVTLLKLEQDVLLGLFLKW